MRYTTARLLVLAGLVAGATALGATSCGQREVSSSPYYDRQIAPVLQHSCSRQTTGCHVTTPRGDAVGNLDTTSFEALDRRRDLLTTYGPYGMPGLLAKVVGPQPITISTLDGPIVITTDIRHAAGSGIDVTSEGFATLRRWMDEGATKDNVGPGNAHPAPTGPCRTLIPADPAFDPATAPGPEFEQFAREVQPLLKASCSAGTCHGSANADLALTCGDDEPQRRWNAFIAGQFLASPAETSELVVRTLDPHAGGVYHTGGSFFASTDDPGYRALLAWAKARGPAKIAVSEELRFFANRVQPVLVRKGCMFLGCHSPLMFHDYTLRGGANGQFSFPATRKNYQLSLEMLAVEAPDPNASRLIAKNVFPYDPEIDPKGLGIRHRGGSLLDDVPGVERSTPASCAGVDVEKGDLSTIPGYCVLIAWHAKERAAAIARGPSKGGVLASPLAGIVYVSRPPDTDVPQAFDRYRPGAELHLAAAFLDPSGAVVLGADVDLTKRCGLDPATADIRHPAVSWDAARVAFGARSSVDAPLAIYTMLADGSECRRHAAISAHAAQQNGIAIHDFDPAWAPDGRLVFASTRGAIGQSDTDYSGPTRTPDALLPNANLYVFEPDSPADGTIRQLTFLLGQELLPAFKHDGRLIFTTEKRAPGFYQLAGRRINLDGTDYHPLFAQRKSIGFTQLTEVRQLSDGNFVGIFSDRGALAGGGALGIINRTLGPDQPDRDPSDRQFLHSLGFPDPRSTGKPGVPGGAYRGPAPLPGTSVLVSYAVGADVGAFAGAYELVQFDTRNGTRRPLIAASGRSIVDAVALFARPNRGVFSPQHDIFRIEPTTRDAELRYLDLPMIASLLFDNRRMPHALANAHALGVLESLPPPMGLTSFDAADPRYVVTDEYGSMWVRRRRLGIASTFDDDSVAFGVPGGIPLVYEFYQDASQKPYATLREELQLYPGERAKGSFRHQLFDGNCGGCHGAISGREVDQHVRADILTGASSVKSVTSSPQNLVRLPADRGPDL